MKKLEFDKLFKNIIEEVRETRDSGQKEYAHTESDVFANFKRVGQSLNISKEQALMVYLIKHIDGINAWVKGHKSQREDVTGRIKDAIVYLCLLWGMAKDHEDDLDAFFDDKKVMLSQTSDGNLFNPATGEVKYASQTVGDEVI
tara:strand:- start:946 stop:1377 length:432 start_codon:yes stop_codon:yes gene_type:complete